MKRTVLQVLLGAVGFLPLAWFVAYAISRLIRTVKTSSPKKGLKTCQKCGKLSTEKLIEVQGDAFSIYVCKGCRAIIKRQAHIAWITIAGCIIVWILFMCYCYCFPEQIESVFTFFEKLFGR